LPETPLRPPPCALQKQGERGDPDREQDKAKQQVAEHENDQGDNQKR